MAGEAKPCPLCGGTGWKPVEPAGPESGQAGEQQGVRRVARCDCRVEGEQERLLAAAHVPPRYKHCDFGSFQVNIHEQADFNRSLQVARFEAERFAQEYHHVEADFGLLLMGPCGVGKTHLAVALLRALIEKGVVCLFCDFRELLKSIQNSYNPVSQTTEMQVLAPVLETEVLLLDDLGASKLSDWVLDTVAHILNSRYNDKRVTLITTNYPDARATRTEDTLADRIGERMRSRLYEMCRVVRIEAEDFRRRVKQAQYQHYS